VTYPPLHDWTRHHPRANAIARDLLALPALLNLKSRRLAPDIQAKYGVGYDTAARAIGIARKAAA
jgi:hypothetical protein